MKTVLFLTISSLLLLANGASAAEDYFCYAPIFAYKTTAPQGWKLDTESGKAHNLCIVGYPEGSSWSKSDTLVYFSAISKSKGSETLKTIVANDLAFHKKSSPGVEVKEGETLTAGDKKVPTKYFYQQSKEGRFEAVSYIEEPKAVIMAVLSTKSKSELEKSMPAFKKLVESYKSVPAKNVSKN